MMRRLGCWKGCSCPGIMLLEDIELSTISSTRRRKSEGGIVPSVQSLVALQYLVCMCIKGLNRYEGTKLPIPLTDNMFELFPRDQMKVLIFRSQHFPIDRRKRDARLWINISRVRHCQRCGIAPLFLKVRSSLWSRALLFCTVKCGEVEWLKAEGRTRT